MKTNTTTVSNASWDAVADGMVTTSWTCCWAHQSCSEFIAWKIYRAFVNDVPETPPRDDVRKVVVQLGKTLKGHKYNLKKTLSELFRSEHFYAAANRAAHIKSPIELVVGTVRDLGVPVRNVDTLRTAAARLGQRLGHPRRSKVGMVVALGSTPAPCSSGRTPRCGC